MDTNEVKSTEVKEHIETFAEGLRALASSNNLSLEQRKKLDALVAMLPLLGSMADELKRLEQEVRNASLRVEAICVDATAAHALAVEKSAHIPLCKTITDFCAFHGVSNSIDLPREHRAELIERINALEAMIIAYKDKLLRSFSVTSADDLTGADRQEFDAALRAFIIREDHYP